jgi:hypothetical protein
LLEKKGVSQMACPFLYLYFGLGQEPSPWVKLRTMFKVALTNTPMLTGSFVEWTLPEMLDSVCNPNLTAVIRFLPNNIELLVDKGQLVAARGGLKLSQVLVQEGVMTKHQLQGAEQLAPTLLEALSKLGIGDAVVKKALRTQLILTLKMLFSSKPSSFEVLAAMIPPSSLSAALGVSSALLEVLVLQETEAATKLSQATIERLIDQVPFEIEMKFEAVTEPSA